MKFIALLLLSLAAFAQSAPPKSVQSTPHKSAQSTPRKPAQSAPQKPGTAAAPAVAPDEGSVDEHTYTSDYFGFRYTFPEGMGVNEDFMEGKQDESGRSHVLLAATLREEASNRTVMIMADQAAAAGATDAASYLSKVAGDVLKRQGFQQQGQVQKTTIAGRAFARADFSRPKIAETVLVTMLRGYAVNFVLMAPSREEVEELIGTLDTLEFLPGKAGK